MPNHVFSLLVGYIKFCLKYLYICNILVEQQIQNKILTCDETVLKDGSLNNNLPNRVG